MSHLLSLAAAIALSASSAPAAPVGLLHPMFQDHAVLQRDRPLPVYGQARPGAEVTVTLGAATVRAKAQGDGHWSARLPATPAGGPYTLEARSSDGADEVVHDVLVGDVFLCGGQSNMQLAVRAAGAAEQEIRAATDPQVRMLTVQTHDSLTPLDRFADPVAWTVESPQTAGGFSATCFYFARELKKQVYVPIGLVVSDWGGSRARGWISEPGLRRSHLYDADLDMLDLYRSDPQAAQRRWDSTWQAWWDQHGAALFHGEPWSPAYSTAASSPVASSPVASSLVASSLVVWATAPATLGPWALWNGGSPDGFVGQMWLRTSVRLTAAQAAQAATLDLGTVNEEDEAWVDGHGVGGTSWARQALHPIPAGILHAGENSVVVNIFCSWRNCGMTGPASGRAIRLADGAAVPLQEPWRYAQAPPSLIAPQLPWGPTHGLAVDYNGMIAPIGPYGFRAALWYQGESDIHFATEYQAALTGLMADWRDRFGADLPFLIVQLPDVGPRPTRPMASEMSDIREAQRRAAVADPHAGYAITIDIGEPDNLHPPNKQEVGRRLALTARRVVYGQDGPAWGAAPQAPYRTGGSVMAPFANVTGALASYSGAPNGFELCGADQTSCRYVDAHIVDAHTVRLDGARAGETRVRYCWGDSPTCTLSDGSALPAVPFEASIGSGPAAH